MKKSLVVVVFAFVSMSVLGLTIAADPASGFEDDPMEIAIPIKISPNTIVLASKGTWVTVHADIPFSQVAGGTVELGTELEGITAFSTFADDCGDLVAKLHQEDVKDLVGDPPHQPTLTLTLTGIRNDGVPFARSDTVTVRGGRK